MNLSDIDELTDEYGRLLRSRNEKYNVIEELEVDLEHAKAKAISLANIDGKNKDTREQQREVAIAEDQSYNSILVELMEVKEELSKITVDIDVMKEKMSMYRAWLYSQSGVH